MTTAEIKNLIFVGHSKGVYEGVSYNKITVSNGIAKITFNNQVDSELLYSLEPEKSRVDVVLKVSSKKEVPLFEAIKVALVK